MKPAPEIILADEPMKKVMEKMDLTQSWYLPVLDADRRFLGFISKSRIFEKYRASLASQTDLYQSDSSN